MNALFVLIGAFILYNLYQSIYLNNKVTMTLERFINKA